MMDCKEKWMLLNGWISGSGGARRAESVILGGTLVW
jgi:hypothetical protein